MTSQDFTLPLSSSAMSSFRLASRSVFDLICLSFKGGKNSKRSFALNIDTLIPVKRGHKHFPLPSPESRPPLRLQAQNERINMQPSGRTHFTHHLHHLVIPCCLALGHDVPTVTVGDETAICCQECHFALRQNREKAEEEAVD